MRALKGFLIYVGITLLILLGIAVILLCIMMFVPSFRLFGYSLIKFNKDVHSKSIQLSELYSSSTYTKLSLEVSCEGFDLTILSTDNNYVSYTYTNSIFGLTNSLYDVTMIQDLTKATDNSTLKLRLSEPSGIINYNDSNLIIYIPNTLILNTLTIKSNSADVIVGNSATTTPDIENLYVETYSGNFKIGEKSTLTLTNFFIKTYVGDFDFSSVNELIVVNDIERLAVGTSDIRFKTLRCADLNIYGDNVGLFASVLSVGSNTFSFFSSYALIDVESFTSMGGENEIIGENIIIKTTFLQGKSNIETEYGDITIGHTTDYVVISDDYGNVTINTADEGINIKTINGNITVTDYNKSGQFKTDRGSIIVSNDTEYNALYSTTILCSKGYVKLINQINKVNLTLENAATGRVEFKDVTSSINQTHTLTSASGLLNVYVPTSIGGSPKAFRYKAVGTISGQIASTHIESDEEYKYFVGSVANCTTFEMSGVVNVNGYIVS